MASIIEKVNVIANPLLTDLDKAILKSTKRSVKPLKMKHIQRKFFFYLSFSLMTYMQNINGSFKYLLLSIQTTIIVIVSATFQREYAIYDLFRLLEERLREQHWVVRRDFLFIQIRKYISNDLGILSMIGCI